MGDSTDGGIAPATAAKPNRTATPKPNPSAPAKTIHQLRIERLFEHAHVLASGAHPGRFHDPSLSGTDIANALTTWSLITKGYIRRVAIARLIEGRAWKDIAAAEGIEIDIARQRFTKAMTTFESIISKLEGPEKTQDENSLVPVLRRVTADRSAQAYMMRKADAEIERVLLPEMHDAVAEIEFSWRYLSGEVAPTANLKAYGIVSGTANPERAEERAMRLTPIYSQWANALLRTSPEAWIVCRAVIIDGLSLRQAAGKANLFTKKAAAKLLLSGLNDYLIRAGRGDVLGAYKTHDPGYAYVIGASIDGPFKVGYSTKPKARLVHLQVGCPQQLTLMFLLKTGIAASKDIENEIHACLRENQVRGDWYNAKLETIIDSLRVIHPKAVDKTVDVE